MDKQISVLIADETEQTAIVVCNERVYTIPVDVAKELEAERADAARYRWLRDAANKADIEQTLLARLPWHKIDIAIDAARKESK
jgi:hypothetical protein